MMFIYFVAFPIRVSLTDKETSKTQDEHMYYSYSTTSNTIQIHDLWDYINQAYKDKCAKIHLEFQVQCNLL